MSAGRCCVKVYMMTDMEGISGVWQDVQVQSGNSRYEEARKLLVSDVNAAVRGAFAGGATDVLVCDGHGGGFHFIPDLLDERARFERPNSGADYMPGLDDSFDALFMVGAHAMAGTADAFLDHTQSSRSWYNYYIAGEKYGETGQCAMWAGRFNVPLVFVAGDRAACEETEKQFPGVVTATVKEAVSRQLARIIHPRAAARLIEERAREAMKVKRESFLPDYPVEMRIEFTRCDYAEGYARTPGVKRVGPREVEWTAESGLDVLGPYARAGG